MTGKKRNRVEQRKIHPHNRYSENPPDFKLLASLYPSFEPFVFYSNDGRPRIDWTDFNASRELTRVLLHHYHNVQWWIPDGQLCPTVPNRLNYIHWIEDLLSSQLIEKRNDGDCKVKGFDIGTGANCIYPLLGASSLGWSFVGSDVTDVALEWAEWNVKNNPHLSGLIEIRNAKSFDEFAPGEKDNNGKSLSTENHSSSKAGNRYLPEEGTGSNGQCTSDVNSGERSYQCVPVLVDVVKNGENFDFCMCNPPFFGSINEAGLNPRTSCGGTFEEMVYPGGEEAFITRIIQDSIKLKHSFRWYTSMVGRKVNLKVMMSMLHDAGVSIVKTTEFVQGRTSRWGLAWSFMSPTRKIVAAHVPLKNQQSFMLEGLKRKVSAAQILEKVGNFFLLHGAYCKFNLSTFVVDITISKEQCDVILKEVICSDHEELSFQLMNEASDGSKDLISSHKIELSFRVSIFEQIPGTLLIRGSLLHKENPLSGSFSLIFRVLEDSMKRELIGGNSGSNPNI